MRQRTREVVTAADEVVEPVRRRRRWWIGLLVLAGVPVLLLGLLWIFQRRIIYQPDSGAVPPAPEVLPAATDVTLRTADGLDLGAWYLPPRTGCGTTVLVLPGNAGNRWGRAGLADGLHRRGYGVLLLDYRGYGGNPGSPDEGGLELDAAAGYDFLLSQPGLGEILVLGESIGGSPATAVALQHRPAGVLLRSPFTDLAATAGVHFPFVPSWLLRDRHPVLERVTALTDQGVTVDVVLGSRDTVVPADQSRQVAAAATGELTVVDADHNDPALAAGVPLLDAVDRLAGRVACRPLGR